MDIRALEGAERERQRESRDPKNRLGGFISESASSGKSRHGLVTVVPAREHDRFVPFEGWSRFAFEPSIKYSGAGCKASGPSLNSV